MCCFLVLGFKELEEIFVTSNPRFFISITFFQIRTSAHWVHTNATLMGTASIHTDHTSADVTLATLELDMYALVSSKNCLSEKST